MRKYRDISLLDKLCGEKSHVENLHYENSNADVRKFLLRDLHWLFNSTNNASFFNFKNFPYVEKSCLNYGIASSSGQKLSDVDRCQIEDDLRNAILNFEPRINPHDLKITLLSKTNSTNSFNIIEIDISGTIKNRNINLSFLFRTKVDLEGGHFSINELD